MKKFKEVIHKLTETADKHDMERLTCLVDDFVEEVREKQPERAEAFIEEVEEEFNFFLTERESKEAVSKMENESREHPRGEKWNKETTLRAFKEAGYPEQNERYSENGVYWAMNMVYSDFYPMYKDEVSDYVEHAYLFLNDKDYSGKYAKEKWYALKKA
jgi:hypothetical protein